MQQLELKDFVEPQVVDRGTFHQVMLRKHREKAAELLSVLLDLSLSESATLMEQLAGNAQPIASLRDVWAGELRSTLEEPLIERLLAALELGKLVYTTPPVMPPMLDDPATVAGLLEYHIAHSAVEQFAVVSLDCKMQLVAIDMVAVGSNTECPVDPKNVFRAVLRAGGTHAIVAHNHPSALNGGSSSLEPSSSDLELTKTLLSGGKTLGVQILDHLIVGGKDWNSLRTTTSLWAYSY